MTKILWIEDDDQYFNAFSGIAGRNYEISRANDYAEAIELLRKTAYDLIIVDIIIPSGDENITLEELIANIDKFFGIEVIKSVRDRQINTPIIALSVVNDKQKIDSIKKIDSSVEIVWKYDSTGKSFAEVIKRVLTERCQLDLKEEQQDDR